MMLTSRDVGTSIGLSIGSQVKIAMFVHPEDQAATLVIGDSLCEIWLRESSLETLRELTSGALRELHDSAGGEEADG